MGRIAGRHRAHRTRARPGFGARRRRSGGTGEWALGARQCGSRLATTRRLARSWPLRGADLWHLAAAKALQTELPELRLLSFDSRLTAAAHGEGLGY
jgi:hypothetical protein